MRNKGILILGNYPPPFGGVPRHIEYLAPYLVAEGWNVHILSGGSGRVKHENKITIYRCSQTKKISTIVRYFLKSKSLDYPQLSPLMKNHLRDWVRYTTTISLGEEIIKSNKIDVISAYNLYLNGPVGAILSEKYGIPLALTNFGEIYSMNDFFKSNNDLIKYVCGTVKEFLSCSRHCAKSYEAIGFCPDIKVVPYGVDINKFSPNNDGSKVRQKLGINKDDKVVIFVGRLTKEMGLHTLMDAIPRILKSNSKIKFILAGAKGDLYPQSNELNKIFKNNISLVPNVPLQELPFYYAASTIAVAPTQGIRACSSLAAMEAMATGKPVIAADVGGIPELVEHGWTGILIPPENPILLNDAVLGTVSDDTVLETMGKRGRLCVETMFDKDKTNKKIGALFTGLLNT